MNLPPLPLIDDTLFIDNSTIELLTTCTRALEYSFLWKRKLNAERSALSFGTAIHSALEYRYRHAPNATDLTEVQRIQMNTLLLRHFNDNPPPLDEYRTYELAVGVMDAYNKKTLIEDFEVLANEKNEPLVELPFAVHLANFKRDMARNCWVCVGLLPLEPGEGISVFYSGRIDLVVRRDKRVWPVDHKTTSMMGPSWAEEMNMSPQTEGYAWAVKKVTGQEPPGACVNGIRVRPPAKSRKPVEQDDFVRLWNYYEPGRLDEWETNVIALIEEFLWHHYRDFMPQKKKWCVAKYGRCQFYDVCSLPPANRKQMLESNIFTANEWDPLKKVNH